jgi:hypothetical protein
MMVMDADLVYEPMEKGGDFIKMMNDNFARLQECDNKAKERATLVGRFIQEPFADGYATYQIIKENKSTVRIRVCTGLGDDWVIPYWGEEATIEKSFALEHIQRRERMAEFIAKNARK